MALLQVLDLRAVAAHLAPRAAALPQALTEAHSLLPAQLQFTRSCFLTRLAACIASRT